MGKTRENTGMAADESQNEKEVIDDARKENKKVDICHLKTSELEPTFHKDKGRVVLRGDIVKDDSGSLAVFTEQGSSASQMTAAKVMDIKSRLPGCAGQAADAVSAYTHVKMEDAPGLLKLPKSECPDILETSTTTPVAQILVQHRRPSRFLLSEIFMVIFLPVCGKDNL